MIPESQMDDNNVICPYCLSSYQPEACDFYDGERVEDCDNCGKEFIRYDEASITYYTKPTETP